MFAVLQAEAAGPPLHELSAAEREERLGAYDAAKRDLWDAEHDKASRDRDAAFPMRGVPGLYVMDCCGCGCPLIVPAEDMGMAMGPLNYARAVGCHDCEKKAHLRDSSDPRAIELGVELLSRERGVISHPRAVEADVLPSPDKGITVSAALPYVEEARVS